MQVAEFCNSGLDNAPCRIPVGDVLIVGNGLAARGGDFGHHCIGGAGIAPLAAERCADIVDHDICAFCGKSQRIGTPQTARRASDDDCPPLANAFADTHYSLSIIVTLACPPPSHMVCSP